MSLHEPYIVMVAQGAYFKVLKTRIKLSRRGNFVPLLAGIALKGSLSRGHQAGPSRAKELVLVMMGTESTCMEVAWSELDLSIKAGGQGSRPMSGRSDKSGGLGGGMSCSDCGSGIGSANGGKGSKSRPLSGRPMWRNPAANNRPVSPGSPGVWHSSLSA
eukprot:1161195-Pelagomonas_calceolata.AAC.6